MRESVQQQVHHSCLFDSNALSTAGHQDSRPLLSFNIHACSIKVAAFFWRNRKQESRKHLLCVPLYTSLNIFSTH